MSKYAPIVKRPRQSIEIMRCRQRKEESLNEYSARFSIECLTVTKPVNSIILLAFRSGLNDDRSYSRRFKEDDGWINNYSMDDVRERAERFTASENFRYIVASLRGENNNNNKSHTLFVPRTIRTEEAGEKVSTKGEVTGMRPRDLHSEPLPNSHP